MQSSSASKLLPRLWATSADSLPLQVPHAAPKDGVRFCSFNVLADGLAQNGTVVAGWLDNDLLGHPPRFASERQY
jgi:hypothetical protein